MALGEIEPDQPADDFDGEADPHTLKIPLSKYKMQDDASKEKFMKLRNTRDFSPITPSKAGVIRTGMNKDSSVLNSPKVSLPSINNPGSPGSGSKGGNMVMKSTFSKKKDMSSFAGMSG